MKRFVKLSLILGLCATLANSLPLQAMDNPDEYEEVIEEGEDDGNDEEVLAGMQS